MKNLLTLKKDANKGITLIALIITIIVLLILTGVTIATLTGENGILTQAKNAKKEMTKAEAKERIQLEVLGSYGTDGEINVATLKANIAKNIPEAVTGQETELPLTVTVGDYTFTVKANGVVEEAKVGEIVTGENKPYTKNGTAVIPVGFAIVPGLDDVSEGLVISDVENDTTDAGNQFVWIPVTKENPFERRAGYYNGSMGRMTIYGEADKTGTNSTLVEYSNTSTSTSTSVSESGSGSISTIEEESVVTQEEAIEMYESVAINGGFYIGRYEAGNDGSGNVLCKKGVTVYNNVKWGNSMADETGGAVELARNFAGENDYDTTKVHSTLCYGVQWDTALNFIDPGYTGYAKDSSKMGWYRDNYNSIDTGNTESNPNIITGKDLIYNTSLNVISNMHKNIYDMAGNVWEWTMESRYNNDRSYRGGNIGALKGGSFIPASCRSGGDGPSYTSDSISFRIALYLL